MRFRFFVVSLACLAAASVFPSHASAQRDDSRKPNFLFLFSDDQRWDTVAAYGNSVIQTPHMDSLVSDGFSFRHAYCMGSIHGAVCQPSRAMLMSGRTLYHVPMDLSGVVTLPELLGEHGYVTFGTGKWHNGRDSFAKSFQQGQSIFFGGMSNHVKVPATDLTEEGFSETAIGDAFSSELFADAVIEFLERQDSEKPFFAYVSFTAPHDPRMSPPPYDEMYDPQAMALPANFLPQHPFHNGWMVGRDEGLASWPRTPEVIREQLAAYYGLITHLDAQIGRILSALKESGQAENTVVVFTADHGLAMGSHGLLGKQNLYDHSMRTPMVIRGPGISRGEESPALVYLLDLFPTLCELADVPVPDGVEGKSLVDVWQGNTNSVRPTLFTTYEDIQRAIRDQRWKLIRYPQINRTQLFDLKNDPHELQDLSGSDSHQGQIERLLELMAGWQHHVDDTVPLSSENPKSDEIDLTGRPRKPDPHQPDFIVERYFD